MRVKILGAHQGENRDARFMSMVIDDRLAIDAGGLTADTTMHEQLAIEAVLVTHRHFDHIKDLVAYAFTRWQKSETHIYSIEDTRRALQDHIFNDVVWPRMTEPAQGYFPLVYHNVNPAQPFEVLGYQVCALEMSHSVPTVGYSLQRDGKHVFYTADTRGKGNPPWAALRPDLLISECTMSSEFEAAAYAVGHMTPVSLGRELVEFKKRQGYIPRTVCVHVNPWHEQTVRTELQAIARQLDADITVATENMVIDL